MSSPNLKVELILKKGDSNSFIKKVYLEFDSEELESFL